MDGFIPRHRSRGAQAQGPRRSCASWALSTAHPRGRIHCQGTVFPLHEALIVHRRPDQIIVPSGNEFALVDVQVGAADTAGLDLDLVGLVSSLSLDIHEGEFIAKVQFSHYMKH
jgi:hypothetical protein